MNLRGGAAAHGPWLPRRIALWLSGLWLWFVCGALHANAAENDAQAAGPLVLLLSAGSQAYLQVRDAFIYAAATEPALSGQKIEAYVLDDLSAPALRSLGQARLVLPVGAAATQYALEHLAVQRLYSIFITADAYRALVGERTGPQLSGLFIDQPYQRYLLLAATLNPEARRISAALGPAAQEAEAELRHQAEVLGLSLSVAHLDRSTDPLATLEPLMADTDLFLAIPDTAVFNRSSSRWVLYLSYRHKVPVIGFSRGYADAGAAAAVYASADDIGAEAVDRVAHWLSGGTLALPPPGPQARFSVRLNAAVIGSLGLAPVRIEVVEHTIKARELEGPSTSLGLAR